MGSSTVCVLSAGVKSLQIWHWLEGRPARLSVKSAAQASALPSGPACCTTTAMSWDTSTFTMLHLRTSCFRSVSSLWAASAAPRMVLRRWWSVSCSNSWISHTYHTWTLRLSFSSEHFLWADKWIQLWTVPWQTQYSGWEHKIPVHPATHQQSRSECLQRDYHRFMILEQQIAPLGSPVLPHIVIEVSWCMRTFKYKCW